MTKVFSPGKTEEGNSGKETDKTYSSLDESGTNCPGTGQDGTGPMQRC